MYLGLSNSEKKARNISMIMNDIDIFQKTKNKKYQSGHERYKNPSENKNKSQLSIEKVVLECKKLIKTS